MASPGNKLLHKAFVDNGKLILGYLKEHPDDMLKAKNIGEGLSISSKTVSGAIRKLVTDGYVAKVSEDPVIYQITEKGKAVELN
jgi:predicted transcriptional regulator